MKFTNIKDLIKRTGANAKAADCLGKSGALSSIDEELNEIEAAEYARDVVRFLREEIEYKEKLIKYKEREREKEKKFREKVEDRRIRQEARDEKYQKRLIDYEKKLAKVTEKNLVRGSQSKNLLKEPTKPNKPVSLKEIPYPKLPNKPIPVSELIRPRATLSMRERIKLQREMLHVYLSGHPLDEVPEKKGIIKIKDLSEAESKSWCTIRGVLQSIKANQTRKKTMMAKLRIEDKTGSIEVVAFPNLYESVRDILVEGELYEILGRVDHTKKESDTGEEFSHIQFIGSKTKIIRVGSDKEWDLLYPLLKGNLRVLPSNRQKSKGLAKRIIMNRARKTIEEHIG